MEGGEEGGGGRGDAGEGGGGTLTLVFPFVLVRRLLCPLLTKRNDKQRTTNTHKVATWNAATLMQLWLVHTGTLQTASTRVNIPKDKDLRPLLPCCESSTSDKLL